MASLQSRLSEFRDRAVAPTLPIMRNVRDVFQQHNQAVMRGINVGKLAKVDKIAKSWEGYQVREPPQAPSGKELIKQVENRLTEKSNRRLGLAQKLNSRK